MADAEYFARNLAEADTKGDIVFAGGMVDDTRRIEACGRADGTDRIRTDCGRNGAKAQAPGLDRFFMLLWQYCHRMAQHCRGGAGVMDRTVSAAAGRPTPPGARPISALSPIHT